MAQRVVGGRGRTRHLVDAVRFQVTRYVRLHSERMVAGVGGGSERARVGARSCGSTSIYRTEAARSGLHPETCTAVLKYSP